MLERITLKDMTSIVFRELTFSAKIVDPLYLYETFWTEFKAKRQYNEQEEDDFLLLALTATCGGFAPMLPKPYRNNDQLKQRLHSSNLAYFLEGAWLERAKLHSLIEKYLYSDNEAWKNFRKSFLEDWSKQEKFCQLISSILIQSRNKEIFNNILTSVYISVFTDQPEKTLFFCDKVEDGWQVGFVLLEVLATELVQISWQKHQ